MSLNLKLTVAMISYNDEKIIAECLESIKEQTYDQSLISIYIVDGGSTDSTVKIALGYGAKVLSRPDLRDRPDVRVGIALSTPKDDLILIFSADNRFSDKETLKGMVSAFDDEDIVGCHTFQYGYRKSDPILSRYFALIGGNDPIAVELGKADRAPLDKKKWHSFGYAQETKNFFHVQFEPNIKKIPTLGANGFIFRGYLNNKSEYLESGLHIDMCTDFILKGHNKFSFYKDGQIVHFINTTLLQFIQRRLAFRLMYSSVKTKRLYSVFDASEILSLIIVILKSITFIQPVVRSTRGFIVLRDPAWFIHPFILPIFILGYGLQIIRNLLKKL